MTARTPAPAEFGIVAAQGRQGVMALMALVGDDECQRSGRGSPGAQAPCRPDRRGRHAACRNERQIAAWHKNNPVSKRLATIPGVGRVIATAIVATIADPREFRSCRELAAWLGLVRQNSTSGKARLRGISKRGDGYLRRLLINGAHAVLLRSKAAQRGTLRLTSLGSRKFQLVVAVALANKTAHIALGDLDWNWILIGPGGRCSVMR